MNGEKLTDNVVLYENSYSTIMTARASKPIFLNGKYIHEVVNDQTLISRITSAAKTSFGIARNALEKTINPDQTLSGNYSHDIHYETEDERAMKLWPDNEIAREAFKLGCRFPEERSKNWKEGYDKAKRASAREMANAWAKEQEEDIKMLESLTPEKRSELLIERAIHRAVWDQESAVRNESSW